MQIKLREIFVEHHSEVVFPEETNVVPGQDCSISELLDRFTRGQRLNVKCREENPLVADYDVFDERGRNVGVRYAEDDDQFFPQCDTLEDLEFFLEDQRSQLAERRSKSKEMPADKSPENSPEKSQDKSPDKSPGE